MEKLECSLVEIWQGVSTKLRFILYCAFFLSEILLQCITHLKSWNFWTFRTNSRIYLFFFSYTIPLTSPVTAFESKTSWIYITFKDLCSCGSSELNRVHQHISNLFAFSISPCLVMLESKWFQLNLNVSPLFAHNDEGFRQVHNE